MEEIKVKDNPTGRKVYVDEFIEMSGDEYDLLVSLFADKIDELLKGRNCQADNHDKEKKDAV